MKVRPAGARSRHSLRRRLLLAISVATVLVWGLTGVFGYVKGQHEAEELLDGHLAQAARLLIALVRDNEDRLGDLAERLATVRSTGHHIYEPPLEFQIARGDGTVLLRSNDAPMLPVLGLVGYSDIEREAAAWRVLNMVAADGNYRIQVAQSIELRDRVALEVASQTVLPVVFVLPLLLLLIYFSVRAGLKPLDDLASEVAARTPDTLSPLADRDVPQEVRPLVLSLNRLFRRLGKTLDNERRFTADAAHELRTPLAAIKIQTQVALLGGDPQVRDHALRQIESGVGRASRLVDQLLRLARLDPLSSLETSQPVDLRALTGDVVGAIRSANPRLDHGIENHLTANGVVVDGDPDLLAIALRNLIDNALRYTPPGSSIHIEASRSGATCALCVRDDGPGVPAAVQARLGERFFRGRENCVEGNGLGLAIVARIAELHGGDLTAGNHPNGGFAATLDGLRLSADACGPSRH